MPRTLRSLLAVAISFGILSSVIAWQSTGSKPEPATEKIAALNAGPSY